MSPRLWSAVWAARVAGFLSRLTGRGGSSLPGLVARRIDPTVLARLSEALPEGALMLTGTNGKTTTAAMLRHLVEGPHRRVLANRAGANLILGITAAFVQEQRWRIRPEAQVAILETDEATMPRASEEVRPRVILVTNFFRDQLDRYGELSTTVQFVARGIDHLAENGTLVLNADDPQVAYLGTGRHPVVYYGLDGDGQAVTAGGYDAMDARFCPHCGSALTYTRQFYAHLGHYACERCGWRRPTPDVVVTEWSRVEESATLMIQGMPHRVSWRMPGIYNLYNEAAAVAAALALGISAEATEARMASFQPAFGRMERVSVEGTTLWLALVKNPVGFNQVLGAMAEETESSRTVLLVINDRYADGRDVSWLWDVDFEHWLAPLGIQRWYVSGIRARDMAVRLKYAGVPAERVVTGESIAAMLDRAMHETGAGTLYVLPTYTAMLEVRQRLTERGLVRHFREG